ncbi:MAG: heavy metal-responsive transcriptional regulator [Actinomycetota bacterium]|nr:heavy metal-responsive transcriptional regulator [Actinomycetota bacterium]
MSQYTVSKLADQVGTSADALRYYERIGLLPEPERSPSGYRLYGDDAVDRVRFIKQAQRFGLRLEAIGELLEIRERGACPCGHTRLLLERRLAEIDDELAALNNLRGDIAQMVEALPTTTEGWQCASELIQVRPKGSVTPHKTQEETTS